MPSIKTRTSALVLSLSVGLSGGALADQGKVFQALETLYEAEVTPMICYSGGQTTPFERVDLIGSRLDEPGSPLVVQEFLDDRADYFTVYLAAAEPRLQVVRAVCDTITTYRVQLDCKEPCVSVTHEFHERARWGEESGPFMFDLTDRDTAEQVLGLLEQLISDAQR